MRSCKSSPQPAVFALRLDAVQGKYALGSLVPAMVSASMLGHGFVAFVYPMALTDLHPPALTFLGDPTGRIISPPSLSSPKSVTMNTMNEVNGSKHDQHFLNDRRSSNGNVGNSSGSASFAPASSQYPLDPLSPCTPNNDPSPQWSSAVGRATTGKSGRVIER